MLAMAERNVVMYLQNCYNNISMQEGKLHAPRRGLGCAASGMLAVTKNVEPNDRLRGFRGLGVKKIEDRIDCVGYGSLPGVTDEPVCISYVFCCAWVSQQAIQITGFVNAGARFHHHLAELLHRQTLVGML